MKRKRSRKGTSVQPVAPWHVISDVAQLKSIANPLRLRLLAEFSDEPRTTKQVADQLGEKPTKLYHHVDALYENGLLTLVREVPKRGTTEKYYQAIAKQFRVGAECFGLPEIADDRIQALIHLLESTKDGIISTVQAEETGASGSTHGCSSALAVGGMASGSKDELKAISKAIASAVKEHSAQLSEKQRYRFSFFLFPDDSSA